MDSEAEVALLRTMDAFNERVAARDLGGTLQLLAKDSEVAVLGSEHGELAVGADAVRAFFERIYRRQVAYSWDWHRQWVWARGSVAWVLAEGDVLATRAGAGHPRPPLTIHRCPRATGRFVALSPDPSLRTGGGS